VHAIAAGWRAADLLEHGREARVVACLSASIYVVTRDELLWLGGPDGVLHPRAVLLAVPPEAEFAPGDSILLPPTPPRVWRPAAVDRGSADARTRGAVRVAKSWACLGPPTGFGARLVGAPLAFPLAAVAVAAARLAEACAADDPPRAAEAALRLLGEGGGLTPSGDDYVGAAFFARAVLGRAQVIDAVGWRRAADGVRTAAARATHPISAALLGDLVDGQGWAPLHDLAHALADEDERATHAAARALTRLGHSSGWDLLAGFVAGIAG